jgi:hypothetical protein
LDDVWTAAKKASKYRAVATSLELFKTMFSKLSSTEDFTMGIQNITELVIRHFLNVCFEPSITDLLDIQSELGKEAIYARQQYNDVWKLKLQNTLVQCGYSDIDMSLSFQNQLQYFFSKVQCQQQETSMKIASFNMCLEEHTKVIASLKTELNEKECGMIIKVSELTEQSITAIEELDFERGITTQLRNQVLTISNTILEHQHMLKRATHENAELLVENDFLTTTVQTKIKEIQSRENDRIMLLEKSESELREKEALLISIQTNLINQEKEHMVSKKTISEMECFVSELKFSSNTELAVMKNMLNGEQERSRKRQCREENLLSIGNTQDGKIVWLEERYSKDSSKICMLEKELATMRRTLMISELK